MYKKLLILFGALFLLTGTATGPPEYDTTNEAIDANGNSIVDVKDLTTTGDVTIGGTTTVSGDLDLDGNSVTGVKDLTVTGTSDIAGVPNTTAVSDCTAVTGGVIGDTCTDTDDQTFYTCTTATCEGAGWATTGGGTGRWDPFNPPAVASDMDDEFDAGDGAALGALWTSFDPGSDIAVQEHRDDPTRYFIRVNGNNDEFAGVYQPRVVGDGDFTAYTYIASAFSTVGTEKLEQFHGIGLLEDKDDASNTNILFCGARWDKSVAGVADPVVFELGCWEFTVYNGNATLVHAKSEFADFPIPGMFLRLRVDVDSGAGATQIDFDWSLDGMGWHNITGPTLGATPPVMSAWDAIGLFTRGGQAEGERMTQWLFFRVDEGNRGLGIQIPAGT